MSILRFRSFVGIAFLVLTLVSHVATNAGLALRFGVALG